MAAITRVPNLLARKSTLLPFAQRRAVPANFGLTHLLSQRQFTSKLVHLKTTPQGLPVKCKNSFGEITSYQKQGSYCDKSKYVLPRLLHIQTVPQQCIETFPRQFHTSSRNNIHPLIWLAVKPLAKIGSIITGRSLRKWWQRLPEGEKSSYRKRLNLSRGKLLAAAGVLLAAGVVNYVTHLQETPITHRRRYIAFTPEQFLKIAQFEYNMQWENAKDHVLPASHPAYQRVLRVGQRIVEANKDLDFMANQKWTVIVVKSREQNAFVLPTGHIFVYTGLLDIAVNDSQLATVIGHEMSHALLSHGAEQVSVAHLIDLMIIMVMAAIWFFMPSDGIALVTQWFYNKVVQLLLELPYSRKLEAEADEVGLQLIAKACYDVRESSTFWKLMSILAQEGVNGNKENVTVPEWLSTHPSNETRVDLLNQLIPHALDIRGTCKCPKLPSKDPRKEIQMLEQFISKQTKEGEEVQVIVEPGK